MIKLKSETILPPSIRETASKEQLLKAYEELEDLFMTIMNDGSAERYRVYAKQNAEITRQIDDLQIDISDEDDPAMKTFLHMLEKSKPIDEGLKFLMTNSSLSRFLTEKQSNKLVARAKNA